jgi:hypothetical protein
VGTGALFPGGGGRQGVKAEYMGLYINFLIILHGKMHNYLRRRTTLSLPIKIYFIIPVINEENLWSRCFVIKYDRYFCNQFRIEISSYTNFLNKQFCRILKAFSKI